MDAYVFEPGVLDVYGNTADIEAHNHNVPNKYKTSDANYLPTLI